MTKEDTKELKSIIDSLLSDLSERLNAAEQKNLLSVSLCGSTMYNDLQYNQDVDLIIILKEIKNEDVPKIENTLVEFAKGGLDLEYTPNVPKIKKIFEDTIKKYSSADVAVKYKFTLGNYWGKPEKGKKYTIHLHVIGPHSIESFNLRLLRFQKAILANIIQNAKPLAGVGLKEYFSVTVSRDEVVKMLQTLKKRQDAAERMADTDVSGALAIAIKNLAKTAMVALESKNIFVNQNDEAGKLFKKHFPLSHNDLPQRVNDFKKNKEKMLQEPAKAKELIQAAGVLLQETIKNIESHVS